MNIIKTSNLQEGLELLISKYLHKSTDGIILEIPNNSIPVLKEKNAEDVPLLYWRSERRFKEMKIMVNDGTLTGISSMRSNYIAHKGTDLRNLLFREFDLAEWIFDSAIKTIFTVKNKYTANIILTLECGIVCTVEVAATLADNLSIIDKHEIIASKGVALDKVVDTQIQQNSVYLFNSDSSEAYTDTDFELYGLSPDDVAIVRNAFEIFQNKENINNVQFKHLSRLIELSEKSAETGKKIVLEEAAE